MMWKESVNFLKCMNFEIEDIERLSPVSTNRERFFFR